MLIKTEKENLYRDIHSKAIIVKDDLARKEFQKRQQEQYRITTEINNIKSEINELKELILQFVNNKG